MSDTSQGPGWWQASDGMWYPPEQAPGYQAPAAAGGGAATVGMSQWGPLADWGTRAIGILIDYAGIFVIVIIGYIIAAILSAISGALGTLFFLLTWLLSIGAGVYLGYLVGIKGRSPGMMVMGTKCVAEETGELIGAGMGIVRHFAHIIDSFICYIGWLFPLWDVKRQTIADKLVKTVVLADQPKETFSFELFKP